MHREAPTTGRSIQSAQTPAAADPRRLAMRLLALCAALWLSGATPGLVHAADYVIDDEQTQQNGGHTIDGNDTLTITGTGAIRATGDSNHAVSGTGNNNTVINRNVLATTGDSAHGVNLAGDFNTVISHSAITTVGQGSHGIHIDGDGNTVENLGLIIVSGGTAHGIHVEGSGNVVKNLSSIKTSEDGAHGIFVSLGNAVATSNSGDIRVSGAGSHAISVNGGGNTLRNSGTLISDQGNSIKFGAFLGNALYLDPGTFLGGSIDLGAETVVHINHGGPSHSLRWDFDGWEISNGLPEESTFAGEIPFFYDLASGAYQIYDPTPLAGTLDQLGDVQTLLSAALHSGLNQSGRHIWATGLHGDYQHDGSETTFDRDVRLSAFAAGYTQKVGDGLTLGVMMSYLRGDQDADSWVGPSYAIESTGVFGGVMGRINWGPVEVDLGVTAGNVDYDQERFINDTAAPGGQSWANSSYGGLYWSIETAVSSGVRLLDGVTVRPAARIAYTRHTIDEVTETGATDNATVGERNLALLSAAVGASLEARLFGVATAHLTGGYLSRTNLGDDAAEVTLVGTTQSIEFAGDDNNALYFGGGVAVDIGASAKLTVALTGFEGDDFTGLHGLANFSVAF